MFIRASLVTTLSTLMVFGTACKQKGGDSGAADLRFDDDLAEVDASRSSWEGTPEGVGLLEFINDEETTFELLDHVVGLDRRAAGNLIAHRDGGDRAWGTTDDDVYNTVDEVDAVRFVGPRTIDSMVSYAAKTGWVPGAQDMLGIYDGVSFTVDQAEATLKLVNSLTQDELDNGLGLHVRAAESIVDAQPVATIDELSRLYYVGHAALSDLKDAALVAMSAEQF